MGVVGGALLVGTGTCVWRPLYRNCRAWLWHTRHTDQRCAAVWVLWRGVDVGRRRGVDVGRRRVQKGETGWRMDSVDKVWALLGIHGHHHHCHYIYRRNIHHTYTPQQHCSTWNTTTTLWHRRNITTSTIPHYLYGLLHGCWWGPLWWGPW